MSESAGADRAPPEDGAVPAAPGTVGAGATAAGAQPFTARCTPEGVYTRVSWFSQALLGYERLQLEGRLLFDLVHPDDAPALRCAFDEAQSAMTHATAVYRHRTARGGWTWLESVVFAVRDQATKRVSRLFLSSRDVSAQMRVQEELRQTQQVLRLAIEHAPEGFAVADMAGRFTMVNPVLARLVEWSEAELLAMRLADLVHPDDREAHEQCIGRAVRGEIRTGDVDERLVARSGTVQWVRLVVGVARDDQGKASQLVLQVSDVHRFKEREIDLERQALLDPLTGVGNRRLLLERLGRALGDRREPQGQVGVILADIDDFKAVNDRYGHAAGDKLLIAVARRIAGALRGQDTVVRFGGDEFVVVCPGLRDVAEAETVLARVRRVFAHPVPVDGRLERVPASVGMVVSERGDTVDSLLQRVDVEMYEAKGHKAAH